MNIRLASIKQDFWELRSGEKSHEENPETFWIPELEKRTSLKIGDAAKLIFDIEGYDENDEIEIIGERINVIVSEIIGDVYIGLLDSQPACIDPADDFYLGFGVEIPFKAEHIINIDRPPEDYVEWQLGQAPEKYWERSGV